jgi:hypothetical protein
LVSTTSISFFGVSFSLATLQEEEDTYLTSFNKKKSNARWTEFLKKVQSL